MNRLRGLAMFLAFVALADRGSELQAEPIDFERDVAPIFAEHCLACHGDEEQESGLRLDRRASLLRGGDSGEPTLVPGDPQNSSLVKVLRGEDPDVRMPPDGELLDSHQVAIVEKWVAQGGSWPGQMDATADEMETDHWSLNPIRPIQPPRESSSHTHPVDAFIERSLHRHGLAMSERADDITLVRRVSYVLTGLPPSPEEIDEFIDHPEGPDSAYHDLIDRLLRSPRYGERWAQHWLDVIRWAETVGFETNAERSNAWPYRDWVIRSLNADKSYKQFLFEQLAGDTVAQDAALGFLVAGPANLPGQVGRDEEAMRQARQDELDEVVRTVGQAFFGLTIGCARCHNHKFDPILQRDYYSMQAIFAGLSYGQRRLRGETNDDWARQVPDAQQVVHRLRDELNRLRRECRLREPLRDRQEERFDAVATRSIRMEIFATTNGTPASLYELQAWTATRDADDSRNVALTSQGATPSASSFALANQTRHHDNLTDGSSDRRQAFPWVAAGGGEAWVQIDFREPAMIDRVVWDRGSSIPADYRIRVLDADSGQWKQVAETNDRMPRDDDSRKADQIRLAGVGLERVAEVVGRLGELRQARAKLARLQAGPQVFAARFVETPQSTFLLRRGDPMQTIGEVKPAFPVVFGAAGLEVDSPDPQRRLTLANHLTRDDHPLTARVIVNRVWQQHFGTGLVDTPSDFGEMGSPPSHPELLDWLAAEFVESGWSLKKLHRLILTSKTFQQSSRPEKNSLEKDAQSRLLWRFPPRRLEAEAIRDSILCVSGKLNLQMGGRGFDLFHQRGGLSDYRAKETFEEAGWRRMIYAHKVRMQSPDIFGAFDCPDAGQMKPSRTRSVTPIQSLSLLNSPFVNRQAAFFADRIESAVGTEIPLQVNHAFRLAFSRHATEEELPMMTEYVAKHGLTQLCRVLLNTSEFVWLP